MKIRRWKSVQAEGEDQSSSADSATSAPAAASDSKPKPTSHLAVSFINASHPGDVVTLEAKKKIRSHAALDVHAGRRARRAEANEARQTDRPGPRQTNPRGEADVSAVPLPRGGMRDRRTALAADTPTNSGPTTLLSAARKDPFATAARSLNDTEHFLLDYYIQVTIPNGTCDHGDAEPLYVAGMTVYWFPLARSDPGLLCGVLSSACRTLANRSPASDSVKYRQMALQYKGACIRSINAAVTSDGPSQVSDATIAKVLALCSDEFAYGSIESCFVHANALKNMVTLRGSVRDLGMAGFLGQLVLWCVLGSSSELERRGRKPLFNARRGGTIPASNDISSDMWSLGTPGPGTLQGSPEARNRGKS